MGQRRADNPVIGYLLVDRAYRVLDPRGGQQDPAFATPAAARYGCGDAVAGVEALHLAGLLRVLQDGGDIQLDGLAAQRLLAVCRAQGLAVDASLGIAPAVADTIYSSRRLLRAPLPRRPVNAHPESVAECRKRISRGAWKASYYAALAVLHGFSSSIRHNSLQTVI